MKSAVWWGLAVLAGIGVLAIQSSSAAPAPAANTERGKYLVEQVARCTDCHSPRDAKGEQIPGKELRGAPLLTKPVKPSPDWADSAPNIAGLRGWDEKDAIKFLMTGIAYNDLPARPPMPQYKLNKEDAEAIVAYLRSLSPVAK